MKRRVAVWLLLGGFVVAVLVGLGVIPANGVWLLAWAAWLAAAFLTVLEAQR